MKTTSIHVYFILTLFMIDKNLVYLNCFVMILTSRLGIEIFVSGYDFLGDFTMFICNCHLVNLCDTTLLFLLFFNPPQPSRRVIYV